MDVALIQWPSGETLRRRLAESAEPRLLLVDPDAAPPECHDPMEDWVRVPTSRADRDARIRALQARALNGERLEKPRLEISGTLVFRGESTQLSSLQADLARSMIENMGIVVSREVVAAAAWPDAHPGENTLDVAMARLRRSLEPVGLRVRTVRSRGYVLTTIERSGSVRKP